MKTWIMEIQKTQDQMYQLELSDSDERIATVIRNAMRDDATMALIICKTEDARTAISFHLQSLPVIPKSH